VRYRHFIIFVCYALFYFKSTGSFKLCIFIQCAHESIRTKIIVKNKKVKEAEKFVSQKIFEYDNCQISKYDYVKSISYRYKINN
jgi:hypothetical protein